jgi:hypothetical protein
MQDIGVVREQCVEHRMCAAKEVTKLEKIAKFFMSDIHQILMRRLSQVE